MIDKLKKTRVLVIGDLMLDHYIWGDVHRISPEAPVPVVHASRDTYTAGGAANVALNLANLGVNTSLLGYFADDEAGIRLNRILKEKGVEIIKANTNSEAPTIIKTRVIIRNQQLCRIDRESHSSLYQIENTDNFEDLIIRSLAEIDAVIISDYAKGVITQSLISRLIKESQNNGKFLLSLDPKPSRQLVFDNIGLLTPNRSEALELAQLKETYSGDAYPLDEVCRKIYEFHKPQLLIITLGAEGMAICDKGKVLEVLPTDAREVFDVSGAGDTVIATLTAALAAGAKPSEAARIANAAAGCVVAHMGTAPISLDELKNALKGNNS